jgi:dihydroorotase
MTQKEDFATGTASAAFGGITAVIDMPNTIPPIISKHALLEKLDTIRKKAYIDYGLYATATLYDSPEIDELIRLATGFKFYMTPPAGKQLSIVDWNTLTRMITKVRTAGKVVAVHAEDDATIRGASKLYPTDLDTHLATRPIVAEKLAVQKLINFVATTGIRPGVHIAHVSAKETVDLLRTNRNLINEGKITAEVTPHHLLLTTKCEKGTYAKVNPPLRRAPDRDALWTALNEGIITIIASDHAPHTIEEKEKEFVDAPSGMPGVETMLPLMLSCLKHHKLSLQRLIAAICETPAKLFNFNKGKIEVGYDADLIVVDLKLETPIKADALHSKCSWSIFEGMNAIFPKLVIVRGQQVVEQYNLVGTKGYGTYIK